ncbi:hypothetical protein DFH06DRAFT_1187276 [Mycena polygramma]|nr:hypothetical protein DFH06DRAFT_1187276 [Mycena polygramma]
MISPLTVKSIVVEDANGKHRVIESRIPALVEEAWNALLSDTPLGRQLRWAYRRPYKGYAEVPYQNDDLVIHEFLTHLYGLSIEGEERKTRFNVHLKSSEDSAANHVAFTPLRPDRNYAEHPTICFTPEHDTLINEVLQRVASRDPPTADDLTELAQVDVATLAAFFHELGHLMWRTRHPSAEHIPEKYKASVDSRAKRARGEGGEVVEVELFSGIVDLESHDLSQAALREHIYTDWRTGRFVCVRNGEGLMPTKYLTKKGSEHIVGLLCGGTGDCGIVIGPEVFASIRSVTPSRNPGTVSSQPTTRTSNRQPAAAPETLPHGPKAIRTIRLCGGVRAVVSFPYQASHNISHRQYEKSRGLSADAARDDGAAALPA